MTAHLGRGGQRALMPQRLFQVTDAITQLGKPRRVVLHVARIPSLRAQPANPKAGCEALPDQPIRTDQASERRRAAGAGARRQRHYSAGHRLPRRTRSNAAIAPSCWVRAILPTTIARIRFSRSHYYWPIRRRRPRRYRHPSGQRPRQFQSSLPVQELRRVGHAKPRARLPRRNDRPRGQGNHHDDWVVHVRGAERGRERRGTADRIGRWLVARGDSLKNWSLGCDRARRSRSTPRSLRNNKK